MDLFQTSNEIIRNVDLSLKFCGAFYVRREKKMSQFKKKTSFQLFEISDFLMK